MSLAALASVVALLGPVHTFQVVGTEFQLDGKPFQIRSGEMHYARVPREYWRDRFKKIKAMGLNTVCTYAFWNLHEPEKGHFDFTGNNDVAEFVREAQQEGLWVLLRPGPYSCAEWEWGGFPYWLARIPNLKVRSDDPRFVKEARSYLAQLGHQLAPLQINHGGPILMTQVENEYGSFGHDLAYKSAIKDALRKGGFDGLLYTADGPSDSMLSGGTLPGVLPSVNFGGDPEGSFKELEKFRPGSPMMCGEFYPGWFDSWGKPHAQTATEDLVTSIDWMESHHASYSLYMVQGGTTFGLMNGANWYDAGYWPQTTSYDYSTTIDEGGRPTDKFWAFRKVVQKYLPPGQTLPDPPAPTPSISIPEFVLDPCASLWDVLGRPVHSVQPLTFEALGQAYGFVLYRTIFPKDVKTLALEGLQDRAQIFARLNTSLNGSRDAWSYESIAVPVGTVYRSHGPQTVACSLRRGDELDILVENCGRINYGPQLLGEHKGIARVLGDGTELTGWENFRLPPEAIEHAARDVSSQTYVSTPYSSPSMPTLYRATLNLEKVGDTFLDMRGWGKGIVWVNGHCLGRYWSIGPQQTLYVPGPWLKARGNDIRVWELQPGFAHALKSVPDPIFELNDNAQGK